MTRATLLFSMLSGLVLLLGGCASDNAVVQKGIFQQRKYVHPGWFVELGPRHRIERDLRVAGHPKPLGTPTQDQFVERIPVTPEEQDTVVPIPEVEVPAAATASELELEGVEASSASGSTITWDQGSARTGMDLRPVDRLDPFVYPAVTSESAGEVDIFALLGFIFAFLVPIAGIVLSAIGLHRTRGGGSGHGLALAGLIIGIVFLVVFGAVLL